MTNEEKHEHWLAYLDMIATQAVMRVAATHERTDPTLSDMRIKRAVALLLADIGPQEVERLAPGLTERVSRAPERLAVVEKALASVEPPEREPQTPDEMAEQIARVSGIPQILRGDPQAQEPTETIEMEKAA